MDISDFDYELDGDLIAQRPKRPRDQSKLFFLKNEASKHLKFSSLPELLREGDILVKNKSKVIPARVMGKKDTGGKVELLFNRPVDGGWECLIKGSNIKVGRKLFVDDREIDIVESGRGGLFTVDCDDPRDLINRYGTMPTPPYIKEEIDSPQEYQTVYAEEGGSIAAPTAGFHFTERLLNEIREIGVEVYDIVLHVGPATFLPVRADNIEEHYMGEEYYRVDEKTAEAVTEANEEGRRIILVGTTTVRALETVSQDEKVMPGEGWTDLFIYPGYEFQSGLDLLLTNFHLPKSTLVMLVSAFAGRERILSAYREAMERGYRFYSFGDAMLLEGK